VALPATIVISGMVALAVPLALNQNEKLTFVERLKKSIPSVVVNGTIGSLVKKLLVLLKDEPCAFNMDW
jgi:hypothetical protein